MLSELDLTVINCLQLHPRATWRQVGDVLEIDAVTVARRWRRLSETGAAWVIGRPAAHQSPESCLAVVEVHCVSGGALETARLLAHWPHVLSVEHTSGNYDLQLVVAVANMASLSRFLLEGLGGVAGIRATRTHVVTQMFRQGDQWELNMLDAAQRARLPAAEERHPARAHVLDDTDRQLILCLGEDGRQSLSELSARLGLSLSTTRRRLDALIAQEDLILRCDAAQSLSGWPIAMWLWARVDADDQHTITSLPRKIPGLRVCLSVTGSESNLVLALAARSMREVPLVEARLAAAAPRLRVLNQTMVLRSLKRMGRILDDAGRSVASVPMDIWAEPGGVR